MLLGRNAERAQLERLLDAVAFGPVGCVLEGMAGIGKTTLWRNSVESARRRNYRVLETAPSEPEAVLAFGGLSYLFERLSNDVLDPLPDAQQDALRAALFLGELPEASRHLQALPRAVLGVLPRATEASRTGAIKLTRTTTRAGVVIATSIRSRASRTHG